MKKIDTTLELAYLPYSKLVSLTPWKKRAYISRKGCEGNLYDRLD